MPLAWLSLASQNPRLARPGSQTTPAQGGSAPARAGSRSHRNTILAGHSIFPMLGQYHIYILFVIAQMVPAGHIIFPMLGQYQIYIICMIAQIVPASHIMFPMIGWYHIYII